MVHCRGIFAPIGEQICDGSYIALVMKKVNGPAQAKLGRGTLVSSNDCDSPGHPPPKVVWATRRHLGLGRASRTSFKTSRSSSLADRTPPSAVRASECALEPIPSTICKFWTE